MIDIIICNYEKSTNRLQWTKVGCGTHLPCQDTNPLTYLVSRGWMDGSPSTQIRLNIKKNKRERELLHARDDVWQTDRRTETRRERETEREGGGRQLNRGACHATLGRGLNGNILSQCCQVKHGVLEAPAGQGTPCYKETKCSAVLQGP